LCSCLLSVAMGQNQNSTSQPAQSNSAASQTADQSTPEIASHDLAATFKVNVRLVVVRVVVRDEKGHAIGNLHKEDFQLFDNKKPQVVTQFSVEQPGTQVAKEEKSTEIVPGDQTTAKHPEVPERFVAYLFDDIHLKFQDLLPMRTAADHHLSSLPPTDRAAIFTTSGQGNVDFTDDHAKIHEAVLHLIPHPITSPDTQQCPYMSYYMADLIENKGDPIALGNATADALQCAPQPSTPRGGSAANSAAAVASAQSLVVAAAREALMAGDTETRLALDSLKNVVRRMSAVPGQRCIVLISPGFITPQLEYAVSDVIDQALHNNTIVSTLDARGLYVPGVFGDISRQNVPNVLAAPQEALYDSAEASANDDVLRTLADSTGGSFFHNNNDLEAGLKRTAATPEFYYVLGFAPQNLKYDGRFHNLNVKLTHPANLTLQARRGYYAPKQAPNAVEEAKEEIQEAVFSQEEMHDLPVELHTQFFKPTDVDAKLAVLVHIDAKKLHFQKADGRNNGSLTIVAALFDHDGAFISGTEKILDMHWKDDTLEHKLQSGVTLKTSFEVRPGSYLVRLVVRDSEGLLSAENGAIEIP
jgi:VWFA-related protein